MLINYFWFVTYLCYEIFHMSTSMRVPADSCHLNLNKFLWQSIAGCSIFFYYIFCYCIYDKSYIKKICGWASCLHLLCAGFCSNVSLVFQWIAFIMLLNYSSDSLGTNFKHRTLNYQKCALSLPYLNENYKTCTYHLQSHGWVETINTVGC